MLGLLRDYGREPGEFLHEMLRAFLIEAPPLMADIERLVEDKACEPVARLAHRLKGTSGHIGALRLATAVSEVENLAGTAVGQATASATATARREFDLAVAAAQGLLARP
jgi:HPt (histidine-containing phosphotransfer) domain-containing protein